MCTLRKSLFQARAQIQKIFKRQIGMQAADNVKFCDRLAIPAGRGFEGFFQRHGVRAGLSFLSAKGAQTARGDADVSGIDVPVDIEIGDVAMHPFAHGIGQPAHGEDVAAAIKSKTIRRIKAFAGNYLGMNRLEPRVVSLKGMLLLVRHLSDDIAPNGEKSQSLSVLGVEFPHCQ